MVRLSSVERRRRLLARIPDILIGAAVAGLIGFVFVWPLFRHAAAPVAPLFHGTTLAGRPFALALERGHFVVLDFFATWCGPCRESLPLVEHFAATEPSVRVLAVDRSEPEQIVAPFVQGPHLKDVVIDASGAVSRAYNVTGLPTIVGIDDEGNIRNVWLGYSPQIEENLHAAIRRYEDLRRRRKAATPSRPS
jgi:thiol-disulfide isomerase/thioredoxin